MVTKTIVLNQLPEFKSEGKSVIGVMSLSGENMLSGQLRVNNVPSFIEKLKMVVKVGNKSFVFDDIKSPQCYDFKLIDADISSDVAVLLSRADQPIGIAFGSCGDKPSISELFDELSEKEIDNLLDNEQDFSDLKTLANQDFHINFEKNEGENFYEMIKPQLDELFSSFPHFMLFEERMDNTEWVKVCFSKDENQHYLLGKLKKGDEITHIMYAMPSKVHSAPPSSLAEFVQWVPLNLSTPEAEGYWVMYQDALTGENVIL